MPLTQSVGTRATAIANPAIEFDNCLRVIENDPATAAVLLEISPRLAITAELIRRMKKPSDGLDEAIRA